MINEHTKRQAIQANLSALAALLATAAARASEAEMAAGSPVALPEMNEAIGAILGLDRELESALALYRAAVSLHKR